VSLWPAASVLPSGLKARQLTELMEPLCPRKVAGFLPVGIPQSRMTPSVTNWLASTRFDSVPPQARGLPSGLEGTPGAGGWKVGMSLPAGKAESLISWLAEARVLPSGLKARPTIELECPLRTAVFLPLAVSQSRIDESGQTPAARVLPSGL